MLPAASPAAAGARPARPNAPRNLTAIPDYLADNYWWAYIHPAAVRFWDRHWLVNLILCGNADRLRDLALEGLSVDGSIPGRTLQVSCVYGDITPHVAANVAPGGLLEVMDILPVQLGNAARKLPPNAPVNLWLGDSTALDVPDATYDQALIFFLLHEQPLEAKRKTLAHALRVVKPGGKLVIVEFHRPSWLNPFRYHMAAIFGLFEPYAFDMWRHDIEEWLPEGKAKRITKTTIFGGLYQRLVIEV